MSDSALFDPDDFGSPQDSGREPRVPRGKRRYKAPEGHEPTSDDDWFVISSIGGPLHGVHRIEKEIDLGSVVTACGQQGRILQRLSKGVDAYLCPNCK